MSVGLCLVSGLIPECGVEQKLLGENRVLWVLLVLVHSSETTDCCFCFVILYRSLKEKQRPPPYHPPQGGEGQEPEQQQACERVTDLLKDTSAGWMFA